jgi:hypothetical protein
MVNRQRLKLAAVMVALLTGLALIMRWSNILEEALTTAVLYFYEGQLTRTTTDAVVIDRRSDPPRGEILTYRFSVEIASQGAVTFTNEDHVDGGSVEGNPRIGGHVKIQYVTDRPQISEILGTNPKLKQDYLMSRFEPALLVHFGLGLLLILIALVSSFRLIRNHLRTAAHSGIAAPEASSPSTED